MAFMSRILGNKKRKAVFTSCRAPSKMFYASNYDETKDVPTLIEIFNELQSKISKLISSIDGRFQFLIIKVEIKEDTEWKDDIIFVEAIIENLGVISKYKG